MDSPIVWRAYEHEHIERGLDWYWALGIAAACIALISILLGNLLFGILIIIAALLLGLLARTPPLLVEFEISDRGVRVGEVMHRYEEIISFWVEDHDVPTPLLLIDTVKWMSPNIVIPLEGIEPKRVQEFLRERVEEVPMKEPFAHKVLEFFGL